MKLQHRVERRAKIQHREQRPHHVPRKLNWYIFFRLIYANLSFRHKVGPAFQFLKIRQNTIHSPSFKIGSLYAVTKTMQRLNNDVTTMNKVGMPSPFSLESCERRFKMCKGPPG